MIERGIIVNPVIIIIADSRNENTGGFTCEIIVFIDLVLIFFSGDFFFITSFFVDFFDKRLQPTIIACRCYHQCNKGYG